LIQEGHCPWAEQRDEIRRCWARSGQTRHCLAISSARCRRGFARRWCCELEELVYRAIAGGLNAPARPAVSRPACVRGVVGTPGAVEASEAHLHGALGGAWQFSRHLTPGSRPRRRPGDAGKKARPNRQGAIQPDPTGDNDNDMDPADRRRRGPAAWYQQARSSARRKRKETSQPAPGLRRSLVILANKRRCQPREFGNQSESRAVCSCPPRHKQRAPESAAMECWTWRLAKPSLGLAGPPRQRNWPPQHLVPAADETMHSRGLFQDLRIDQRDTS
jgi:hypothetical protein